METEVSKARPVNKLGSPLPQPSEIPPETNVSKATSETVSGIGGTAPQTNLIQFKENQHEKVQSEEHHAQRMEHLPQG